MMPVPVRLAHGGSSNCFARSQGLGRALDRQHRDAVRGRLCGVDRHDLRHLLLPFRRRADQPQRGTALSVTRIVASQAARPVEDRNPFVRVFVHPHRGPHGVLAVYPRRKGGPQARSQQAGPHGFDTAPSAPHPSSYRGESRRHGAEIPETGPVTLEPDPGHAGGGTGQRRYPNLAGTPQGTP
jgi:hypothetical protein